MRILHYLKRALSLPPQATVQKAWRKAAGTFREKNNRRRDFKSPTYTPSSLSREGKLNSFFSGSDIALARPWGDLLTRNAEKYLRHEFDLLGSGPVQVVHGVKGRGVGGFSFDAQPPVTADSEGRWLQGLVNGSNLGEARRLWGLIEQNYVPIDWQLDFKSGFRWSEKTWSPDIQYGLQPGADVKVPWELARSQHLPQMGLAYALSDQEDFRRDLQREFRNQVLDFIAANPPRFGVNWVCSMDVGIRIANWLAAYDLFGAFGASWDRSFEEVFLDSVHDHARHIFTHLEWDPVLRSNHYLADIVGLLFAGAYLPRSPEADKWLKFSAEELLKEVESQFHEDGSNFEASTSYHRLSAEIVVYATALIMGLPESKWKVIGKNPTELFSESYRIRLEKMAEFTMAITKPDGLVVQTGDNDSGRFLRILPEVDGFLDHRHLVAAINGLIPRREFTAFAESRAFEGRLVSALAGGKGWASLLKPGLDERQKSYPDFGLYVWKKEPLAVYVRCGAVGQKGNGGHAHNDQLSFELSVRGVTLVLDPGTFVYTPLPDQRNLFRSTAAHNTMVVGVLEQNSWEPGVEGLFRMEDKSQAKAVQFDNRAFIGEHRGFGSVARRTLNLKEGRLEGLDECDHSGLKSIYFHLAPGCQVQLYPPVEARVSLGSAYIKLTSQDGRWELEKGYYSRAYGEKEPAQVLVLKSSVKSAGWKIQTLD